MNNQPPEDSGVDSIILERFKLYRDEIKHEFDLITGRLNAYLSAQSFLILAYAAAMNTTNNKSLQKFPLIFSSILAVVGIILSLQAIRGIAAADYTVRKWNLRIRNLRRDYNWLRDYQSGREEDNVLIRNGIEVDPTHEKGLNFPRFSPYLFILTWVLLLILAVYLQSF